MTNIYGYIEACDCKMSAVDPDKPCDPETGVCNCKDKTIAGDRCDQYVHFVNYFNMLSTQTENKSACNIIMNHVNAC